MKANELRIGNLVNDYGVICEINPLILSRLYEINNSGKACINLSPIRLTEDWLVKFGFESRDNKCYTKWPIQVSFYTTNPSCFISTEPDNPEDGTYVHNIKYLHQLQNLYFALTGTELMLTPLRS